MGEMQVHGTAWLIVIVMLLTAVVQPFGKQKLLQFLELGTLCATWMTLWAGTIFNSYPKCEDGEGGTIGWCDTLSVLVGVLDIAMACVAIAVVVYLTKQKECDACCGRVKDETVGQRRRESVARETERRKSRMESKEVTSFVNPTLDSEKRKATPDLGIEMTSRTSESANGSANGKQRIKRLSKVMKARQVEYGGGGAAADGGGSLMDGEMKTVSEVETAVTIHVDEETGRRYSYDAAAGKTQWLEEDDGKTIPPKKEGESEQRNRKNPLFRKIVSDKGEVYYENTETGEVVWMMPKDGELIKQPPV